MMPIWQMLLLIKIEFTILLVLAVAALVAPRYVAMPLDYSLKKVTLCSQRPGVAFLVLALLAFAGSALYAYWVRFPEPGVYDEFGYLLAADTFASGRVTNPMHEFWEHFETLQVLPKPTYSSKYPPAQGLILAVGQLMHHPVIGLWLSAALATAGLGWMLLAWLPRRWAFIGTLLFLIRIGIPSYWAQSYWGGFVAMFGGCLLFGSLRRMLSEVKVRHAVFFALGLILLANSRPMEGFAVSLPCLAVLMLWGYQDRRVQGEKILRLLVLPSAVILLLGILLMGWYNFKVTGHVLKFPYMLYQQEYDPAPLFLWQKPGEIPDYKSEQFFQYHRLWYLFYENQSTLKGYIQESFNNIRDSWYFYLGVALTLPLICLPWILRNRWRQFAVFVSLLLTGLLLTTVSNFQHYAAPVTCLILFVALDSLRCLRLWRPGGRAVGRALASAVILTVMLTTAIRVTQDYGRKSGVKWHEQRAELERRLERQGKKYLIIVRYDPNHKHTAEWVYNKADIDSQAVIWARDLGEIRNRALMDYYPGREVLLIEVNTFYSKSQWLKQSLRQERQ